MPSAGIEPAQAQGLVKGVTPRRGRVSFSKYLDYEGNSQGPGNTPSGVSPRRDSVHGFLIVFSDSHD